MDLPIRWTKNFSKKDIDPGDPKTGGIALFLLAVFNLTSFILIRVFGGTPNDFSGLAALALVATLVFSGLGLGAFRGYWICIWAGLAYLILDTYWSYKVIPVQADRILFIKFIFIVGLGSTTRR